MSVIGLFSLVPFHTTQAQNTLSSLVTNIQNSGYYENQVPFTSLTVTEIVEGIIVFSCILVPTCRYSHFHDLAQ